MKYIALIIFVLLLSASTHGCLSGGGLHWTLDGKEHSFSWRAGGKP